MSSKKGFVVFAFFLYFSFLSCVQSTGEHRFVKDLIEFVSIPESTKTLLYDLALNTGCLDGIDSVGFPVLYKNYPKLKSVLPYVSLGEFPTKIQKMSKVNIGGYISNLYIKRDDLAGKKHENCPYEKCPHDTFGGGKVRKLEFVLADALHNKAKAVLPFSSVGSNHAAATTFYAHNLGLKSIVLMMDDLPSKITRRNIFVCHYYGEDLYFCDSDENKKSMLLQLHLKQKFSCGSFPYIIPESSFSFLDSIAFVNAAFELKEQIVKAEMPEPSYIYIPLGTMRSVAGLLLGLRAAGIFSKVVAIKVGDEKQVSFKEILECVTCVRDILFSYDDSFPIIKLNKNDVAIVSASDYEKDMSCDPIVKAIKTFDSIDGLSLYDTYASRAFKAFLCHIKNNNNKKNDVILFWNTYYDNDFLSITSTINYTQISKDFHHHFNC
ncbi:pyridoxal-phosphate dependent enzyme [bacterium]|nr:pyridoxal-phosphate dependent enzyme [bacterium]